MTQEEKELLFKDLSARLPYGVKVVYLATTYNIQYVDSKFDEVKLEGMPHTVGIDYIKPYLRPLSSMTEEEKEDLKKNYHFYFDDCGGGIINGIYSSQFNRTIYEMIDEYDISSIIDWLNANHFDYRGLIDKELAIVAPEDMYK